MPPAPSMQSLRQNAEPSSPRQSTESMLPGICRSSPMAIGRPTTSVIRYSAPSQVKASSESAAEQKASGFCGLVESAPALAPSRQPRSWPSNSATVSSAVQKGGRGVPVFAAQGPAPLAYTARTRTRYALPLVRPVRAWRVSVPTCPAFTQPAEGFEPEASAWSAAAAEEV